MKKYTFELIIHEGNDEFWNSINGSGCDEVRAVIEGALSQHGFFCEPDDNSELKLIRFEDE